MFEKNDVLANLVAKVFDAAANLDRGDVLTWGEIETVLNLKRYEGQWKQIINAVKLRIRNERGIATRAIVNVGLLFFTVKQQLHRCPEYRQQRAIRQITHGIRELQAIENEPLSVHEAMRFNMSMEALKTERKAIRNDARALSVISRPKESIPQNC